MSLPGLIHYNEIRREHVNSAKAGLTRISHQLTTAGGGLNCNPYQARCLHHLATQVGDK